MSLKILYTLIFSFLLLAGCSTSGQTEEETQVVYDPEFPSELIDFKAYKANPVFKGSDDSTTWDEEIRERGFIIKEDSTWYMWYTGYTRKTGDNKKYLGLAISTDGLKWERYQKNPIHKSIWVEDVFVLKSDSTYYMFAESKGDTAHLLTSRNRIDWKDKGRLDIRLKNGKPIEKGAF